MAQFDGLRPARLKVGIVSAGRVGTALGVALERAEHVVVACSAISEASRQRARRRLPDTLVLPGPRRRRRRRTAAAGRSRHRTGRHRVGAWPPPARCGPARSSCTPPVPTASACWRRLTEQGCLPLAIHPAMTFTGSDEDITRLSDSLLRHHRRRRDRLRDRAVTGPRDRRRAVPGRRGRPHPLPRRALPRRQPHGHGGRRRAGGIAGGAARPANCSASGSSTMPTPAASPNACSGPLVRAALDNTCNAAAPR